MSFLSKLQRFENMLETQHEDDDLKRKITPSLFIKDKMFCFPISSADWDDLDELLFDITQVADIALNNWHLIITQVPIFVSTLEERTFLPALYRIFSFLEVHSEVNAQDLFTFENT